ncbi:MAG: DUF2807 domain-containing protein, partial [Bacteroidota bacterium]|nr:DUF2807 domain-containing protein [Bacteroidota bacterium]
VMNGEQSVIIEADDNVLQYVITDVENGMLNVHYKSGVSFTNTHIKVRISAPVLNKLSIGGSGDITAKNVLKADRIEFKISGSGDVEAEVDAPSDNANISGSGTISLRGKAKDFNTSISGSGDIKCKELLSENTTVSIAGSGTAHVFASVHLNAKVSGAGDIYYSGNPPSPEIRTSGAGSVQAEK